MSLEELRATILTGVASTKQDRYISMPLEGRVDLLMPKGDSNNAPDESRRDPPIRAAGPVGHADVGNHPTGSPAQQTSEDMDPEHNDNSSKVAWDAAHHPPPKNSRPEMAIPMTTVYAPAWDEPSSASAAYFEDMVETALDYPALPNNVRSNDWYGDITATKPDPRMVSNVFPWENDPQSRPTVTRRFPRDLTAEGMSQEATPFRDAHDPDTLTGGQSAGRISVRPGSPSHSRGKAQVVSELSAPHIHRPMLDFAESMASYTNAWDEVASITTYAKRLTALGIGVERRAQANGLETAVGTPRGTSTPSLDVSSPRRSPSSSSADGDDEAERDEGLHAKMGRGRSPTYRDREAQTERFGVDAMVQTSPGLSEALRPSNTTAKPPKGSRPSHSRQQSSRSWDPNTDVDLRRQDSTEVLQRFMKANAE